MMEIIIKKISSNEKITCSLHMDQDADNTIYLSGENLTPIKGTGSNLFLSLNKIRKQLETLGYIPLCNGARKDAHPSRMSLQMSNGRMVYILKYGYPADEKSLVDIFDEAPENKACSIEEQEKNYLQLRSYP